MKWKSFIGILENYLKVITADKQPAHTAMDIHMQTLINIPFNRLKLPVDGTSDGYANTNTAALFTNWFWEATAAATAIVVIVLFAICSSGKSK